MLSNTEIFTKLEVGCMEKKQINTILYMDMNRIDEIVCVNLVCEIACVRAHQTKKTRSKHIGYGICNIVRGVI